jgi:hypothetical protein
MFIPIALVLEVDGRHISSFISIRKTRVTIENYPVFCPSEEL